MPTEVPRLGNQDDRLIQVLHLDSKLTFPGTHQVRGDRSSRRFFAGVIVRPAVGCRYDYALGRPRAMKDLVEIEL